MCCFASRVERMKKARKSREEAKKQRAIEAQEKKNRKKSRTPIKQVARDGNSFYSNPAYLQNENTARSRSTPTPVVQPTLRDDRFEKSIYNGRVLSSALGRTIGTQSAYRITNKADTLMESSIDGFQTGEPSTASTAESNSPKPPIVGPVGSKNRQSHIPMSTQENVENEYGSKNYIPKGAVPSIGPNFQALIDDVKQTQERNKNLSGHRQTTVGFGTEIHRR